MSEQKKGFWIHVGFGVVVCVGVIVINWSKGYPWTQLLCDGFFVAAVILLGGGGLKFCRNEGVFDMLTYSVSNVFQLHYPFTKMNSPLEEKQETFVEYKERKRSKRKPAAELVYSGLVYLALSLIMLVADFLLA